jgi:hypothetical protein
VLAPSRVPVLFILFSRILYTKRAQRQMNFLSKNMSFLIISVSTLNYPSLEHFCPLDFASKKPPGASHAKLRNPAPQPRDSSARTPALPRRTRSSTAKPVALLRRLSHHASFRPAPPTPPTPPTPPNTANSAKPAGSALILATAPPLVRDRAADPITIRSSRTTFDASLRDNTAPCRKRPTTRFSRDTKARSF